MRSMVKGDVLPDPDELAAQDAQWRQRRVRRQVFALGCLLLAAYFVFQMFTRGSDDLVSVWDWRDPGAILGNLRAQFLVFASRLRHAFNGSLPAGDFGMILKIALCAVAAAVFLRAPQPR